MFSCKLDTFCFEGIPFGLIVASFTFQGMMLQLLDGLKVTRAYLGSVVVISKDSDSDLRHVMKILERMSKTNLKLKLSKRFFAQS